MPTDRSMPAVMTTSACAMATKASSTPLLAAVCTTLAVKPDRVVGGVDGEHHHKQHDRDQRAAVLGQPEAPLSHALASALLDDIQRAGDQRMFGEPGARKFGLDGAVVEHQHPVAAADQFVVVGRVEEDRRAVRGELAQELVDLLLGADVDAARGVVQQDDPRPAHQPLGDHHLLLVSARKRAHRQCPARRYGYRAAAPSPRSAPPRPRGRRRRRGTHGRAPPTTDSRAPSSTASALRSCGPRGSTPCPPRRDRAVGGLRMVTGLPSMRISPRSAAENAEAGEQQLALALPVKPAEAHHLAGPQAQRDRAAAGPSSRDPWPRARRARRRGCPDAAGRRGYIRGRSSSPPPRASVRVPAS